MFLLAIYCKTEHKQGEMTVNSSANSVILILVAFSDNFSAENSKSSAGFKPQLLECMHLTHLEHLEHLEFLSPQVVQRGISGKY